MTALKRSESLQDVPASVSVLGEERLAELGVSNLVEIGNLTSGIAVAPVRSRANIFVRGVGQLIAAPNVDSSVALNLNGVFLPQSFAATAFFDVDRIEVLPGPQGTLYGRNSTGGVINVNSRVPGSEFGIDGLLEVGNYDHVKVELGLDVPIGPTLSSRTAAAHNRHDGYMSNGANDQKTTALRQALIFEPSPATRIALIGSYTKDGGVGAVLQNDPFLDCGYNCASYDPEAEGYYYDSDVYQFSLQADQDLTDTISVTYIGGYSDLDQESLHTNIIGAPGALYPFFYAEKAQVQSHEVRLNLDSDGLSGILGAYYFDEDIYNAFDFDVGAIGFTNSFDGGAHGYSFYGQFTYPLTDALRLTGGLRYSHNVKSIEGVSGTYSPATGNIEFNNTPTSGTVLTANEFEGRLSMNRLDWKIGFEFDLSSQSLLYGSVATGFTPGGFSSEPVIIGELPAQTFKPINLVAYAAGIKNELFGDAVTLNLEAFYYDYKNYQISERDAVTRQAFVFNAEKSTIYGFQLDAHLRPTSNDDFSASVTYAHAQADKLRTPAGKFDGFDLPFAPRWTANASYRHDFELGDGSEIRGGVNFKYVSDQWLQYTQANPGFFKKAYTHTDLNLGYHPASSRWSIQAYLRNLENERVKTNCAPGIPGPAACYYEAPRTYGLLATFDY